MNIQKSIVDTISPHVTALMQLLTNDFPQYNMRLITTKCLNTGIMIAFALLGKKGFRLVDECDSNLVTKRHKEGIDNNQHIINQLKRQVLSKREKKSKLYYILLSDGYFQQSVEETQYFPGHVVIIEKHFNSATNAHYFRIHQSYINQYTLTQYNSIVNKNISMNNIESVMNGLEKGLTASKWSRSNIKLWSNLTNVDTSNLKDTYIKNRFFLCFRKTEFDSCISSLKHYVKYKLTTLKGRPPNDVYGDVSRYIDPSIALTNTQMEQELNLLKNNLESHERICYRQ